MKRALFLLTMLTALSWSVTNAQVAKTFTCDFENSTDASAWTFLNGSAVNQWYIGTATHNGSGSHAMYISNDNGVNNNYTITTGAFVYAYHEVYIKGGTTATLSFDWKTYGENGYDYLRVALIPLDFEITANTIPSSFTSSALPNGWIALDGGTQLSKDSTWKTKTTEVSVPNGNYYRLAFIWKNDDSYGSQPPAAIDNVVFNYTESDCLPPTNLTITNLTPFTATLNWEASASSTAVSYGIWMYTSPITEFVNNGQYYTGGIGAGGRDWTFNNGALNPYTQYYAYMRTNCGGDSHSEWVEIGFFTPPTCATPLDPQVTIQNKSTATLSWTPGDNSQASNYEYVLSTSPLTADQLATSGPNVCCITETSVELTNLTPETTYYLYLRNNCGGSDPSPYAEVVEFTMPIACDIVRNLSATNITTNSVTLTWNNGQWETANSWVVEINGGTDGNYTVTESPTLLLSGLTPGTAYTITVRTDCGDSLYSDASTIVVNTLSDGEMAIGQQDNTSSFIPVNNYWKYSYTQQIFTASELQPGNITKIAFQYLYDQPMTMVTDATIYMGHCTKSNFSSTTDWVPFSDLTPVYTGSMNCTQGWNTFELSTPFAYNGTDNLVIAVHKNADISDYDGDDFVFATSTFGTSTQKTLYYQSDDSDCSPEAPIEGYRSNMKNIVRFTFSDVRHDPVTVDLEHPYNDSFEGDLQWDLYQGPCVNAWAQGTATHNGEGTKSLYVSNNGGADNNYTLNKAATIYAAKQFALAAGQYDIRYDWKAYGESTYDYLRVALVPASTQLAANTTNLLGLSTSTLPDGWTPLDGGNKLNLSSSTWVTKKVNNVNVTEDGVYMVVFIWRNDGSGGTPPPAAIDNFSISRVACSRPFNLQAQNITSQSANLYWEMNGQSSETFTYILHNTKFIDTTNTSNYAYATGTNTTVQNLNPYSNYFYIVKTNCGTDGQSHWTEPMHFMTTPDCGEQGVRQFAIGTQPNTGNSYPAYNYSSAIYGANWMIFTADEIMEEAEFAGTIKGLAWRTPQAGGFPFQIYMAQTNKTEFESATDTVDRTTMTKVFDGYPDFLANEWSEVVFDTPFEYDATGNLLVMVYRSSSSGNYPFEYSHYNDTKTIYRYGAQGLTSGSTSNNRINTRFTMCVSEDECLPVQNLTISNIRPDSYDFSWTDGRNASVVIYEHAHHVLEGEDPSPLYGFNTLIGDGVYGGTCTGLTPGTTYAHYVRVNCGTSRSQFKKVTITTECNYITLPYTCGFESEDGLPESETYPILSCWHRINDATSSTNYYPYVNSSSSYAHHGNNSLLFYTSSSSSYADNQLAVLPPVSSNYPMNHNQMTFWAKHSSSYSSTTIQVGTMTDAYDASTFVVDTTLQLTSEYREYVTRFHSNGIFPAIRMVKTSETQGAYIDDITIEVAPACPKPLYVTADNITSTEARISWTPGDEESLWQIDYMSEDGVSGSSLQTSENPCTITGLMANKTYTIRVRSVCDGNYLSAWSTPFSFRTSCDTYTPLPYTENFDLYTQGITTSSSSSPSYPSGYPNVALPSCWTFPNMATTTSGYPKTYIWKTSDSERENVLIGNVRKGYGGSWFAVLPKASEYLNNLMISFSYAGAGDYTTSQYPVLKMGYMTDPNDTTTFHELFVCPLTSSTTQYLHEELLLDTLQAIDAYIAFKAEPRSTSSYQVRIDDIRLEVIPTCFKPTDLSVEDLTHNSIMLTWEDPQDESPLYQIAYGPSSSFDIRYNSTYTITTATTTTCNITGLQSSTEYSFAVRTKCGDGDWSYWSQTISAKTSCLLTSLPYTENFDSYTRGISTSQSTPSGYPNVDMPDCWTFVNRTKTSSGKIFLTKSNDFAASGNALLMYGNTNTPLYAVLPAFDEPLTNLQISFTYTFSSECTTCNPLTLGYMTNPADANTFHTINNFPSNKDFVEVEQLLDEALMYQDTGKVYLAFLYQGSANVGIDNVCVKEIPACRRPELTLSENWFGSGEIYFNCTNPNAVENDTFNYQLATGHAETFDLEDASTYTITDRYNTRPTFFSWTWAYTPNTEYSFAIRVQCSDNTWSEWSNVVTRKTGCSVVDLPYKEYFDTYTQGISTSSSCPDAYPNVDLPECWTIVNASEYRTQKPQAFLTSSRSYTKSGKSLMLYASEEKPVYAMLPKFFEAGNSQPLKISFYCANTSSSGTLSIGYLYRNNDYYNLDSYTELYSYPLTSEMTYVDNVIDSLPNGARITLRYTSAYSSYGMWIDEVEVVPASTCSQTVNITSLSNISHNKINVNYDGEGLTDGSQYKLAFGPAATFDPYNPSTYENSYTFITGHDHYATNLQPNTEYAFAMAIVCPGWVTGNWSRVVTAKTLCDAYTTLPYIEDFNSYTEGISSSTSTPSEYPNVTLPECWSFQNTSYNSPAFLTSSSSYVVSGNSLILYPKSKDTIVAILPWIDEDIRNLKLTFSYKNYNTGENYPKLSVGYMTGIQNAPTVFNEIAQLDQSSSWTEANVLFESAPEWASTYYPTYIAIKCASPNYSGRVFIDNVKVRPAVCAAPINLTVNGVTSESVTLEWSDPNGTATEYEVIYASTAGIEEDEPTETMTVTSNTATISGLSGNTEYTFAVRALCEGTDLSDWSSSITAKTLCGAISTLPYVENFDSYTEGVSTGFGLPNNYPNETMPECWTFVNRSDNSNDHPFVILSQYNGFVVNGNALFFRVDTVKPVYAVLPAFEKNIQDLKLSFYYRNEHTGTSANKLSVGYMTDPTDASTFVELQDFEKVSTMTSAEMTFRNVPENMSSARIAFKCPTAYIDQYLSIDEVMVEEFIDPCDPVLVNASNPYVDDFESDQCWQLVNGTLTNAWAWGTATHNGEGEKALYISNDGGTSNAYTNSAATSTVFATKLFTLDTGLYNFQYDWMANGESTYDYLRVALAPATTQLTASGSTPSGFSSTALPSGWIALDGGSKLNLNSSWTLQSASEVYVPGGTYMVVFAWRNDGSKGSNPPAAIDNFSIKFATCQIPTNVLVDNITESGASVSWTPTGMETQWEVMFVNTNTLESQTLSTSTSTVNLTGLQHTTTYNVYVRTICGDDDVSGWNGPVSFTTLCGAITTLPYTCGFEPEDGVGTESYTMPYCWTRYNDATGTSNYYPYVSSTTSYAHNGDHSLYFYASTSSSYANHQIAILPEISTSVYPMNNNQMTLWAKRSTDPSTILVGTMTDPADTNTFVTDTILELTPDYLEYVVRFHSTGAYPAIKQLKSSSAQYAYVDDIKIEPVPSCAKPLYVNVNNFSQTSASISWTPGNEETMWDVKCESVGADTTAGTLIMMNTMNPSVVTGLQPGTKYNVYVRSVCGADDMSEWSVPATFTTLCLPMSLSESIYTENFDDYFLVSTSASTPANYPDVDLPNCWTFLNRNQNSSSYPQAFLISSSTYAVSGNALFFKSSQTTPIYAILPSFEENIRNMMISFDYRYEGTGTNNGTLSVGYMTDPSDESTFVSLRDMERVTTLSTAYVPLNTIPAEVTTATIAFRFADCTNNNIYSSIDNVIVQPITTCLTPLHFTVTEAGAHSVSLEWDDTYASAYQVAYAPSATFNLDSGLYQTISTSTTSATISGLLDNTAYTFAVRTDCGEGVFTNWTSPVSYSTLCDPMTTLPYTETFDSYSNGISTGTSSPTGYPNVDMPDCWTFLNRGATATSTPRAFLTSSSTYAVSGNALFFYGSSQTPLYALLPSFEGSIRKLMLTFTYVYESTSESNGTLSVGYMTNPTDASTFVEISSYARTTTKTTTDVYFNTVPADSPTVYIAFKYSNAGGYYLGIDNVTVQPTPDCVEPQEVFVTEARPNAISLGWTVVNENSSSYQVAYAPSNTFNLDNNAYQTLTVNATSTTVSGLTENTAYTFAVRSDCGEGEWSDWSVVVSSSTTCPPITTLPYTCGFETTDGVGSEEYALPNCWTRYNDGTAESGLEYYNYYPYVLNSTSNAHNGGGYLRLYIPSAAYGAAHQIAILPEISTSDYPMNHNQMTFWARRYDDSYPATLLVGTMTNPIDLSTFVAEDTLELSSESYREYVVRFHSTGSYPAIMMLKSAVNQYAYVDDITIETVPACPKPLYISVNNTTDNSASFSWTPGGEETQWEVKCVSDDSTDIQTLTAMTNPFVFTGLRPSTRYNVYAKALCGDNEESIWSEPTAFRTEPLCEPITTLPYTCGFETEIIPDDSYPMPDCWQRYNDATGSTNYYPYVYSSSSGAHNGSNYLYFYASSSTSYADHLVAVLPEISTSVYPMNGNQITLWAKSSYTPATLLVGTMTNPADLSTFVLDDSLVLTDSYSEYVVKFHSTGSYPAIMVLKSSTTTTYAYVDDITIEPVPACPKPLYISVGNITDNSASFSWTPGGEETQWEVKCVSDDSTDIQTLTAMTNPFVFTGLRPSTRYNVYAKALCGDNEESIWSEPAAFRTEPLCEPITTLPYTCGFEKDIVPDGSYQIPDCWQRYNDATGSSNYHPYVSTSTSYAHTGSQALYFYSYTSSSYAEHLIAVLPEISTSVYPMNGNQMTLWGRSSSSTSLPTLLVGTMTNPADLSTFVIDDTLTLTYTQREYVVKFHSTGAYPAIMMLKSSSSQYAYVDDITIDLAPSCPKPLYISVDNITETSASFSWTPGGDEPQWEVKCVSDDNTDTQTLTAATNPFVFTGLRPATVYNVYVRAICGDNDESVWSTSETFRTSPSCPAAMALPYTENFNDYYLKVSTSSSSPSSYPDVDLPDCWTFLNRGTTTTPRAFLTSLESYAVSGNALFFQSDNNTPLYAVLPAFEDDIQNLKLSFTYRNEGTGRNNGTLSVGYITDPTDINTYVDLQSFELVMTMTPVEFDFNIVPADVSAANIAFKYTGGASANYYLSIDDVMVTEAPVEECPAISQLPYTEDFNSYNNVSTSSSTPSDYPNVDLPECWTFLNRSDTSFSYPQAFLTSYYSYAVSGNALFFKSSKTTPLYAVLPSFAEDIRNLMLSFSYRNERVSQHNGTLAVGYLTNPADASTFVELRSFEQTTTKTSVEMIFNDIPANVTASNIAFKYTGGTSNNYYLGIDDVVVDHPTCMMPRELTITDLTPTSVSLAWTDDNSNAGSYQVAYAPSATFNLADSEDYDVVWTNTNSATINGLSDATEYTFAVLTYCNDEDFSNWSNPITAKTPCLPLAELPYICGFEENIGPESQPLPECWYRYNDASGSSNYYPYVSYNSSYANHGNRYLNFYSMVNSQHADHMIAVLPKINTDLYPMDENQMVLWAKGTYTPTIQIGTMTDPHDFSTFVADSNLILTDEYLEYVVKFHSTGAYPAILLNKGSVDRSVYIDDITIGVVPSCPKPMYVTVDTITETSATISWTPSGEESQWEARCEKWDGSDMQTFTATANSLTLTGLLSGTRYNVYVRAFCSDNNWSEWSSPATFKIDPVCLPIATLPYTEDFNNYTYGVPSNSNTLSYYPNVDMPDCWTFLNRSESTNSYPQAFLTSYFNYVVSGNALFLKSSNTTPLYAVLPTFIENVRNLMLSFTYRNEGVSEQNGTLSVGYLTDPTDASTFVEIRSFEQTNTLTPVEVSFSEIPAGVTASNIAFKYTGGTSNNYYLSIDEVMVISVAPECAGITIPYDEDFESMTSGSTPNCWSFLPDVANATVPLVSAGSANAQSGDNSVYMTSRGILVLPEITNVDNVNNLMMTFYVKQRKFAQRIAVGVMTDPNDPTTFTEIDRFFNDGNYSTPVQQTINFSSYSGSGKYIAFRNVATNSDAMSQNWIDDISITEIPPVTCEGITIPYYQNFDSITTNTGAPTGVSPDCWTFLPDVSNATIPQINYGSAYAQSGNYSLAMTSRGIYVMPEITNVTSVNGLALSFYVRQKKYAQRIAVGVMSDPNDPSTFTEVERFFNDGNYSTPVYHIMDFSSYTGNGKYIAFRNVVTNSDALSQNWIDDINIFEGQAVTCNGITVPYEENFDSITTNTGTPTGASPACWTFLPDVDNPTIPQVSYGTDNAQSGNYSLAMTSRGIYVMPEVTNIDNVSDLVMTFYVKQRKFAHRIAVGVMTDPTDPTTFVEIDRFYNDGNYSTLVQHSVNFSSYTGSGKYIAFRNVATNSDALSQNWIDNISLQEFCGITVPYVQNFDSLTTNTGTSTGVSPRCWTFLPDVDNATIPQVSYGADNAQSGNYSLAMTSRGIYVMPEIINVDNVNNLTMTFYVKQRKFAHRIAVGVMTDPTDPNTFVEIDRFFNDGNYSTPVQQTVNFASYTGNGKYIAFRNVATNSDALSNNWIDDINITEAEAVACEGITIPYSENFDAITTSTGAPTGVSPACWTFLPDVDNATIPQISYGSANAQSGNYSLAMTSRGIYALPEITNVDNISNLTMTFYVKQRKFASRIAVGVMTDPTDPNTFVEIDRFFNDGNYTTMVMQTVDFSSYTGNGKYIAFRNVTTSTDASSQNWIDDINISEAETVICDGITVPYTQNFDAITSNTGAPTGVSPACWTFLPDVDGATIPQISYGSANAQSGNYSLAMTSRGIYALPEITNVESINGLTMTFYVKQRKYAHRIAVGVMSDPTDPTTFVEVERFFNGGEYTNLVQHSVDFSSYTGTGKYIAFRNVATNSDALSNNWIDDINISATEERSAEVEQTSYEYTDNDATNEVLNPTSIDDFDLDNFTVYPNPTTGKLNLGGMEAKRVEVNSLTGQKVAVFENTSRIDISNLPSGVYILKVILPQGTAVRKVVKR